MFVRRRFFSISAVHFKKQLCFSTAALPIATQARGGVECVGNCMDASSTRSFISKSLKISAKLGLTYAGKNFHAHIIKLGLLNELALQNQLLHAYVKCAELVYACKLFDEMAVRNIVTWNTLICGVGDSNRTLASNGCLGLHYFKRMLRDFIFPDHITFMGLFRICMELDDPIEIGRGLHCLIEKLGFCKNHFLTSVLVDFYGKIGLVAEARLIFDNASDRDLVLWNTMVSCYALNDLGEEALKIFYLMQLEGIEGDEFTFTSLLSVCGNSRFSQLGRQIHGVVYKLCVEVDVVVASTLIDMYSKTEDILNACKVFDTMSLRNVISWTTIIVAYGQHCNGRAAFKLLNEQLRENLSANELALASVISSCGRLAMAGEVYQAHAFAIKNGTLAFRAIGNALTVAYSMCGSLSLAFQSFRSIPEPDIISWTSMIQAYAFHGCSREATDIFEKMLSNGIKPDGIVFLEVLSACSHGGLVHEGMKYFTMMSKDWKIEPSSVHYTCLVDLLGRVGLLNEALHFIVSMPVQPGSDTLGAFMGACNIHGNVKFAKWAARKLSLLDPNEAVNYTIMSSLCASAGRWYDVAIAHRLMKDNNFSKIPGLSWTWLVKYP